MKLFAQQMKFEYVRPQTVSKNEDTAIEFWSARSPTVEYAKLGHILDETVHGGVGSLRRRNA